MPTFSDFANYASIASLPLSILLWLITVERFHAFWRKWRTAIFCTFTVIGVIAAWRIGWMQSIWLFATANVSTPRWLFWTLVTVAVCVAVAVLVELLKNKRSSLPTPHSYTQDYFLGARWRWRYRNNYIDDPRPYCPTCEMALVYSEGRDWTQHTGPMLTIYFCENCNREVSRLEGDREYVVNRVVRQIDRNIRTDAWREIVAREQV